jgi:hypothetical protein
LPCSAVALQLADRRGFFTALLDNVQGKGVKSTRRDLFSAQALADALIHLLRGLPTKRQ